MRILLLLLLSTVAFSQQRQVSVKFLLTSPDLHDTTSVYITGSIPDLGFWNPGKVKMEKDGNHVWSKEIRVSVPIRLEYKYTLGSWEREGAHPTGAPLPNFEVGLKNDTTISDTVLFWTRGGGQRVNHGQVTGTLKYHKGLKGNNIPDRDIVIWLPPDYDTNPKKSYPVLYMHDGQNIFDPATSAFGFDWQVDESADSLIRAKAIEPVIIVGINNTNQRMQEYIPGDKSRSYMEFVVKVVKPLVDATYRTKRDRMNTFVGGSSAGGIISFMLVWEYPQVFSKAICMSPAFKPPSGFSTQWNYATTVKSSEKRKDVFFYIDNGGVGLESDLQPGIDEMISALQEKGYKEGKDFVVIIDKEAKHFELAWAKRMPAAMKLVVARRKK